MMQKFLLVTLLLLCMLILVIFGAKKSENVPVSPPLEEEKSHVMRPTKPQETSRIKLHRPKSLASISEYELCKQECKRKRDQESMSKYVQWLNEELKFAEEQLRVQNENQQSVEDQKDNYRQFYADI